MRGGYRNPGDIHDPTVASHLARPEPLPTFRYRPPHTGASHWGPRRHGAAVDNLAARGVTSGQRTVRSMDRGPGTQAEPTRGGAGRGCHPGLGGTEPAGTPGHRRQEAQETM